MSISPREQESAVEFSRELWAAPIGADSEMQGAGITWDAVSAPSCIGDSALSRLDGACGAVIRDAYGHRLTWLLPLGSVGMWQSLPRVEVLGPAMWVEVPPAGRVRGMGPYWERPPCGGRLLTNPGALHAALAAVCQAGRCANRRCP